MLFSTIYYLAMDVLDTLVDFAHAALDFFGSTIDLSAIGLSAEFPVLGLFTAAFFSFIVVRIVLAINS